MEERRRAQRNRCMLSSRLAYNQLQSTMDGRIVNMSNDGACLQVDNALGVPDYCDVMFANGTARVPARVVWRKLNRIGLKFETIIEAHSKATPVTAAHTVH